MEYNFKAIEEKWQAQWSLDQAYKTENDFSKPKCYVLDMFPYPSGSGLHVGHPLGYIASDIYSRYKRLKGFNVLHPMGFDSFGLPAEQYALETGQHPADTTAQNITTFKEQLRKIGFCYDWSREVRTSDASYYKWTQWIFLQLFHSYFDKTEKKAKPLHHLIEQIEKNGLQDEQNHFTADDWRKMSDRQKADILMHYRLAFVSYGEVNWCAALGTVLANDEVINGLSERGGHPVEKKKMRQWYLRIIAYADRLLEGLNTVQFSDSMKEMQRNWIGKSEGAEMTFTVENGGDINVYTTRPDTIFGVDFLVLAPEHALVDQITTAEQRTAIDEYLHYTKSRSDRERMAEVKQITGCFTGAYAINPFDGKKIPVWIAEYVLVGYGTGAIMAVPCGDQRDFSFAKHFNIPITNIIGDHYNGAEANATKEATLQNSDFLDGLLMKDAIIVAIEKIESLGVGKRKVNYRMRDAGFSRQRYWGEPFPIVWKDEVAHAIDEKQLPIELPHVDSYSPGPDGQGPLANITDWVNVSGEDNDAANVFFILPSIATDDILGHTSFPFIHEGTVAKDAELDGDVHVSDSDDNFTINETGQKNYKRETSTMPGYAGSSWYFLRYMDPQNDDVFCDRKISDYWNQVDMYIGGTEHAVGHLLYSRLWTKVLFDLGHIGFEEPFKKLVNQGMITGKSFFFTVDGINKKVLSYDKFSEGNTFLRYKYGHQFVDVNGKLRKENFDKSDFKLEQEIAWEKDEQGLYILLKEEAEKMSKSKFNVDNPDDIVEKYGADTFRMYEMFLGPVEMSKPWDTKGIEGVHRFLRKLWRLFFDDAKGPIWHNEKPTAEGLKVLHKTIKKIDADTENFSYNTAVSAFMVCVNELTDLKCHSLEILQPMLVLLSPYAPHIAEELWHSTSAPSSVLTATYPVFEEKYTIESTKEYPISINGKLRTTIEMPADIAQEDAIALATANETVQKWLEGKTPKKVIFVKGKMVNVVV